MSCGQYFKVDPKTGVLTTIDVSPEIEIFCEWFAHPGDYSTA